MLWYYVNKIGYQEISMESHFKSTLNRFRKEYNSKILINKIENDNPIILKLLN